MQADNCLMFILCRSVCLSVCVRCLYVALHIMSERETGQWARVEGVKDSDGGAQAEEAEDSVFLLLSVYASVCVYICLTMFLCFSVVDCVI